MKKIIVLFLCAIFAISAFGVNAQSSDDSMPYDSYVYRWSDTALSIPAPFVCEDTYNAADFGLDTFTSLSDIYTSNGKIYLCDSGNNRIVVLDSDWHFVAVIESFDNNGINDIFNNPTCIYERNEILYIADSLNSRIIELNVSDYSFVKELNRPEISLLDDDYTYTPLKITVDTAGRVYVIAEGVNRGLIELDSNGEFSTFLGAPSVVPNFFELIWRKIATKEQRDKLEKYVPTEYDSLYLDDYGFIYAVSKNTENQPFVKLNSQGTDVLQFEDNFGDSEYVDGSGLVLNPYFVDLAVDEDNCYYLLDSQQGKVYVYTQDGNQLYTFGANGSQQGTFYSASAIEIINDRICVIDASKNTINIFKKTEFGNMVTGAVKAQNDGEYDAARTLWENVQHMCSHYPMAIIGIAQLDIIDGNYKQALVNLKAIDATELYDKAFKKIRDEFVGRYMGWIILVIVIIIFALIYGTKLLKKIGIFKKISGNELYKKYAYGTYAMKHPFDGFWDIKREERGSLSGAILTFVIFVVLYGIRSQFTGYNVLGVDSSKINALSKCVAIVLPIILFIVANWCFSTLMDGEGTFRDIVIFTFYSLKPYVWASIPMLLVSQIVTSEEIVIYNLVDILVLLWVLALLFVGMMMTHNYSFGKTVLTTVCTLVGICLLLFIVLLILNVAQDVVDFVKSLYSEIAYRSY